MAIFPRPWISIGVCVGISAIALATALPACGGDDDDGAAGTGGGAGVGGTGGTGGGTVTWCDVKPIANAKCSTAPNCHGPQKAAPVGLATYADTQQNSVLKPSSKVWQEMQARINSTSPSVPVMPPASSPSGSLSASEKTTLNNWFAAGATQGSCE
jgi:hypothetical protein